MNNNERRRLLLVDDEQDITFTISIGLEDNGFVVDSFNDPLLALQSFKEKKEKENQPYALALLDVKMPKMNGFDLYNEMRKIDDKIKACFITAFDIQEHEIAYIVSNNKDKPIVIRKPIATEELVKRIKVLAQTS
jgi:DNA-binding response OmpR family regulator